MIQAEQFYWGKFIDGHTPRGDYRIVAVSAGLTPAEADQYLTAVYFGSHERIGLEQFTHGYSFAPVGVARCVFTHVRPSRVADRGHLYPVYHGLVLPIGALPALRLHDLLDAMGTEAFAPDFAALNRSLPTLPIPDDPSAGRAAAENEFVKRLCNHKGMLTESLLNALLTRECTVGVENVPPQPDVRMAFVEALWELLPRTHRHWLSFCTDVFDGGRTTFKLKCLYPGAGGRTAQDVLLNYATLELHPLPKASNHYVPLAVRWLIAPESPKKQQAFENVLKQTTETYAVMPPEEQLHVAAAVYGVLYPADSQAIPADLLATALRYPPLIPEKEQKRLVFQLFEMGLQPQQYALWEPLLTAGWLSTFATPLLKYIQALPELRPLVAGLRGWLWVDEPAVGLALLKLIGTPTKPLVVALAADAELLLRAVELYFENDGRQELVALLNALPEDRLESVFRHICKTIRKRPQIGFALEVMRESSLAIAHKKAFYFQLIERAGWYADEIGMELLDQASAFALTYDEKVRLLALNLPLTYRNRLLGELTAALLEPRMESDNTGELVRLLTAYATFMPYTGAVQALFGSQSARHFALLSGQAEDYLARLNAFAAALDEGADGQNVVEEVRMLFGELSAAEQTELLRALDGLRDLLEPKGKLMRMIPSSAALKRLLDILKGG
jgi:hypothetical protein